MSRLNLKPYELSFKNFGKAVVGYWADSKCPNEASDFTMIVRPVRPILKTSNSFEIVFPKNYGKIY